MITKGKAHQVVQNGINAYQKTNDLLFSAVKYSQSR